MINSNPGSDSAPFLPDDPQLQAVVLKSLQHIKSGILITDASGTICWANPALEVLTSFSRTEIIGRNPRIFGSGKTAPEVHAEMWATITQGEIWCGQMMNRRKDQSEYIEELCVTPVFNSNGIISHYYAIKHNVSEVVNLAQLAHRGSAIYQSVFLEASLAMLIIDPDSLVIVNSNGAASSLFHIATQNLQETDISTLFQDWEKSDLQETIRSVVSSYNRQITSIQQYRCNEGIRYIQCQFTRFGFEDHLQLLVICSDCTDRELNRRELTLSQHIVAHILETVHDILIVCDNDNVVSSWNQAMEQASGISSAYAVGKQLDHLPCQWPINDLLDAIAVAQQHKSKQLNQVTIKHANGSRIFMFRAIAMNHDNQGTHGVILHGHDITAMCQEQHRRLHADKMESIGQLSAGIAHEINTPVQYIGDNLQFLRDAVTDIGTALSASQDLADAVLNDKNASECAQKFVEIANSFDLQYLTKEILPACIQAQEGVQRVSAIVSAMRDFSHPGSDSSATIDINRCIESTCIVSRNEYKYAAELKLELDQQLPLIQGITGQINQVILNLIVNAAYAIRTSQFSESAPGLLRITSSHDDDWVEVCISDNGCGIPDFIKPRIFDPFFTTKPIGDGSGQGLALAYDIVVHRHGGSLTCVDNKPCGTTFIMRLPIQFHPPQRARS